MERIPGVAKFWQFAWSFTKRWWALMSCAAFTLLGVLSAVATNGSKWTIAGTITLALVFGVVGSFQLWSEQHQRALTAEDQLATERLVPRIKPGDWQELAEKFHGSCRFVRATYQLGSTIPYDYWSLSGASGSMCEAWVKQAGVMLLRSPRVLANLPNAVRSEPDPTKRWLKYLKENGRFRLDSTGIETLNDGTSNLILLGTTYDLATDSAKLCIECSTQEM